MSVPGRGVSNGFRDPEACPVAQKTRTSARHQRGVDVAEHQEVDVALMDLGDATPGIFANLIVTRLFPY